ncbi:septum formation initiator family protein [Candidatus Uhrbacteria bacterium]|nr:septum formation initiator family protein [Candidatus Uhrbacteria bacterium]
MPHDIVYAFRRMLTSRIALVASIVLCAFLFFRLVQVVSRSASTGREIASLKSEVESLQSEQKRLEHLRSFLQTDFFTEQEARTKFGLRKEGERTVIIVNGNESARNELGGPEPQTASHEARANGQGSSQVKQKNYRLWWQYFFGRE